MRTDLFESLNYIEGEVDVSFSAYFYFPRDLPLFKGHFPNRPLLPAVMQIEMLRSATEAFNMAQYSIAKIIKSKFSAQVPPDEDIEVVATMEAEGELLKVRAKLKIEDQIAATISVLLKLEDCDESV